MATGTQTTDNLFNWALVKPPVAVPSPNDPTPTPLQMEESTINYDHEPVEPASNHDSADGPGDGSGPGSENGSDLGSNHPSEIGGLLSRPDVLTRTRQATTT